MTNSNLPPSVGPHDATVPVPVESKAGKMFDQLHAPVERDPTVPVGDWFTGLKRAVMEEVVEVGYGGRTGPWDVERSALVFHFDRDKTLMRETAEALRAALGGTPDETTVSAPVGDERAPRGYWTNRGSRVPANSSPDETFEEAKSRFVARGFLYGSHDWKLVQLGWDLARGKIRCEDRVIAALKHFDSMRHTLDEMTRDAAQMLIAEIERLRAILTSSTGWENAKHASLRQRIDQFATHLATSDFANVKDALDARMCCNGQMCGCYGATVGEYLAYELRALL